jgi:DmsE family decaheme c-type cytochrome
LLGFVQSAHAEVDQTSLINLSRTKNPDLAYSDSDLAALREYAQQIAGPQPQPSSIQEDGGPHSDLDGTEFVALRDYARQIGIDQGISADTPRLRLAAADNAFDALREFLGKQSPPSSTTPETIPNSAPKSAPRATPKRPPSPRPAAPRPDLLVFHANFIGTGTCLMCHANQAASFGKTLMGRISKTQPGKFECENCHGPGSAHLQAVGCAACHGEGGITKSPGTPSLVGQDPQYLVPAMKAYITGQRRNDLMKLVLSGVGDAELRNIASYYARQTPGRAPTPLVGDPSSGKRATEVCAGCHGERGVSVVPAWPSLAGQDATYLAEAISAYKRGTRTKVVACAACHGEGGVSRQAGIPSLAGQDQEYLVSAMRTYGSGERKHGLMNALLSDVSDGELNNWANYYAGQAPARAQTPFVGDPSAGKSASSLCVGCHGEGAGALSPEWPNLAGQDSQYLANAIKAYQHGSRDKAVACAACHGERGVSKLAGTPSLVGLDPQYLVAAMKAYGNGQRKSSIMNTLFAGVGDAELNRMANYFSGQPAARAQTSAAGDASAGKAASAACAACHGEQGVSANPAWPSLAGQDARYLAAAMKAYKDGSRGDATMKPFVASLDDKTINDIASYYAGLPPARPAAKNASGNGEEPALISNRLVESLDERAVNDVASYFASLRSTQQSGSGGGGRPPVVVANRVVASLDDRAIGGVASYYATLRPEQPASASNAPGGSFPLRVGLAAPIDGSSIGGIISFRKDDPSRRVEDNNAICLNCHERGERTYWNGSVHESRAVACTQCHTIMKPVSVKFALKMENEPPICFQCHQDKRAQILRSSHMPLREGKITCSDCHNPHGTATEALLRENSINDNCYKCHAEKRGPFLFEHAPVRENCLNCHDPHGSNNEYMLKVSRPRLCAECHGFGHGLTSGPLAVQTMARSCQNCHNQVHGTNSPAGALLHR